LSNDNRDKIQAMNADEYKMWAANEPDSVVDSKKCYLFAR
jgi:hypothetical protein